MKLPQVIASLLVCILFISPALAAVCATSCAAIEASTSLSNQSSQHCHMMVGMNPHKRLAEQTAHQETQKSAVQANAHQHQQNTDHKNNSSANCGMAGCNTTQVLPLLLVLKVDFAEASPLVLTSYYHFGISADVSPPIKPPA